MTRLLVIPALLTATMGCIIIDADDDQVVVDQPVYNTPPAVYDGEAGCYYDRNNRDDIVWFEAWVDDADGWRDVMSVWADVYDDSTGQLVQTFELYPTDDPNLWFSDWLVSTTWIDCWYPWYSVDLIAYDSFDEAGGLLIYPATYAR